MTVVAAMAMRGQASQAPMLPHLPRARPWPRKLAKVGRRASLDEAWLAAQAGAGGGGAQAVSRWVAMAAVEGGDGGAGAAAGGGGGTGAGSQAPPRAWHSLAVAQPSRERGPQARAPVPLQERSCPHGGAHATAPKPLIDCPGSVARKNRNRNRDTLP